MNLHFNTHVPVEPSLNDAKCVARRRFHIHRFYSLTIPSKDISKVLNLDLAGKREAMAGSGDRSKGARGDKPASMTLVNESSKWDKTAMTQEKDSWLYLP
jgi:hypothetical protein